jgi:hypothetical protein
MTLNVFFHVFSCDPDPNLVTSLFRRLVDQENPVDVIRAMIRAPAPARREMCRLFSLYISDFSAVTDEVVLHILKNFMQSDFEIVCEFSLDAVIQGVGIPYFVNLNALTLFLDCAFVHPNPALTFLLEVTTMYHTEQSVVDFWSNPLVLSSITDAILGFHSSSAQFTDFLLAISRDAPEWLVKKLCKYMRHLPCRVAFGQICVTRFSQDSPVIAALNKSD